MSSSKQGVEGALGGEIHISSALSRLAKLRFLKIKMRTRGAATDLVSLALGREQDSWGMVLSRNLHQRCVEGFQGGWAPGFSLFSCLPQTCCEISSVSYIQCPQEKKKAERCQKWKTICVKVSGKQGICTLELWGERV